MAKSMHSFTLDADVSMKLEEIENKSELVNNLLKTYFGTANYSSNALEQTKAKIEILQEQMKKEQEQANKIIIEEKNRQTEIQEEKRRKEDIEREIAEGKEKRKNYIISLVESIPELAKEALGEEPVYMAGKYHKAGIKDIDVMTIIKYQEYKKEAQNGNL
jgi:hypothetical protein